MEIANNASNDFKLLKRIFFFMFLLLSICKPFEKDLQKPPPWIQFFYRDETFVIASTSVKKNHFVFLGPEGVNFQ